MRRAIPSGLVLALLFAPTLTGCKKKKLERLPAQISLGTDHSCAAMRDLSARCWGKTRTSSGSPAETAVPARIIGRWMIRSVAAGRAHTCALVSDGTSPNRVVCWTATAAPYVDFERIVDLDAIELSSGGDRTCARTKDGAVWCWNGIDSAAKPERVALPGAVEQIAVGAGHACARLATGGVVCWGDNAHGQLGDGTKISRDVPVAVQWISNATRIAAGLAHTCARLGEDKAMCWGKNDHGQLGDGSLEDRTKPVQAGHLSGAIQLALGGDTSCARMQDASVTCWGDNHAHQMGDGSTSDHTEPALVHGLYDVVEVAVGGTHACARFKDDRLRCWGGNGSGQVGDGSTLERGVPVDVKFADAKFAP